MEILSEMLRSLQVTGSIYFCEQLSPPWHSEFTNKATAGFHLIRQGRCWLRVNDQVEQLNEGDLVFLGAGIDHFLSSEPFTDSGEKFTEDTLLLCGDCKFEMGVLTPLHQLFPRKTIVRAAEFDAHPWLKGTFEQISAEYMAQSLGNEIIVNKLTEVILVELIRINFGRNPKHSFLAALKDKRIKKALTCLHGQVEKPWTIELLAEQAGMSRATLARQFKLLVGETVFNYLSMLRVEKAKQLLLASTIPIDDISLRVGYESERAFGKTFHKYVGLTPRQFRKNSTAV